jgi:hypothetical protein
MRKTSQSAAYLIESGVVTSDKRPPTSKIQRKMAIERGNDVQAGYILWLPKKHKIDPWLLIRTELDEDGFNHPVLILSVNLIEQTATIFTVSTLIQRT